MIVTNKREPVLVPYWIIKQLQRNSLPLNTVLKLPKLLEVCSQEDIVTMFKLNLDASQIFGTSMSCLGLANYWSNYSYDAYHRIQDTLGLYAGKLEPRLFGSNIDPSKPPVESDDDLAGKAFDIYEVDSGLNTTGVILIVIHPGYFGGENSLQAQQQVARAYLKQSYVFCGYEQLARDPVFAQYVRTL